MSIGKLERITIYAVVVAQTLLGAAGCRQEGNVSGPATGGGGANASSVPASRATLGEVAYRIVRRNLQLSNPSDNPQGKVAAFDARKDDFVTAVDTVIPATVASNLRSTLDDVIDLIDDGTLPSLTDQVANIAALLANDPSDPQQNTLNAIVKLASGRAPLDTNQMLDLASRMLAYPESDQLMKAIATLVEENDGLTATGAKSGARDLLGDDLSALAHGIAGIARPAAGTSSAPGPLVKALLASTPLRGGVQVGAAAWAVRVDANGNPQPAVDPATGKLYTPFVDANGDGVADVDAPGAPVDANGQEIAISAFGQAGAAGRDASGRALAYDGNPLYVYFDAKQTTLSQVLIVAGKLLQKNVPFDLLSSIDACSTRVQRQDQYGSFTGYADDNPLTDVAWGGLEVMRDPNAAKLLESLAALIDNDPARAEQLMVSLAGVVQTLNQQQFQSAGLRQLVDGLVPVFSQVFASNGGGQAGTNALAIQLLNTFRTQIQQVRGIPAGLAGMMKYSTYPGTDPANPGGVPTDATAGRYSCMEQLMNMMAEANQCDSWPFGNMADFYLDAMAGNKSILGFTISVHTIATILNISLLRSLMCSQIDPNNLLSLQAFANSGALDSLIPIVKAFSDAGQTDLIKNVFLTLGSNYPSALRPNEPVVVQILESGMVEQMFDALNVLEGMTVPSTGEPVTNIVAQLLASLVNVNAGVVDRHGASVMSRLHLVLLPFLAMQQRIQSSGVSATYSNAMTSLLTTALATAPINQGSSQAPQTGLLYEGIVPLAAAALRSAASAFPADATQRAANVTSDEQSVVSLMTGRVVPLLLDNVAAVQGSPSKQVILDALVNVFTPNLTTANDIFGSVLQVAAATLQVSIDPTAMVDLLHFGGEVLDPARGTSEPLVLAVAKLLQGQANTTLLSILHNALDRGPTGSARSPAETLLSVFDDVKAASASAGQPLTAAVVAADAQSLADFIRDPDHGLEAIYTAMRGHPR
jgi:hypothetical protein